MYKSILIFSIISFNISVGQELNNVNIFENQYKKITYKLFQDKLDFFSLNNIENSTSENIIRFWNTSNCIQLEKSNNFISGKIIFVIQNSNNKLEFLRKEISLSENQINEILKIIADYKLDQLPTEENIKNWKTGFDGNLYEIELLINKKYQFKSYWTPEIQDNPEGKLLVNLKDNIEKIVNISSLFKEFISQNKFPCYKYYGTSYSVCTIYTKKEARRLKRSARKMK